jgi:antirestriction protein ArdC
METKQSVYDVITGRILESLKNGVVPWRQPWASSAPKNLVSNKPYQGVNNLLLACQGYSSEFWLTYKQASDLGGQVRKGEKSTPIIFWNIKPKKEDPTKKSFLLRYFSVFNATQCDGLTLPAAESKPAFSPIEACENLVKLYKTIPKVNHGGDRAYYAPTFDQITMPHKESFSSPAGYYSTFFHEMVHSTGHESRLKREGITNPIHFASHSYSFEELVAEIGSAFLCGKAGIVAETLESQTAYINNWASKLKSEPKWIIEAASKASRAAEFIQGVEAAKVEEVEQIAA